MTREEILKHLPNASLSTIARNLDPSRPASRPQPQQVVWDESMAAVARKESHMDRVIVRIRSFRTRLLDPDNLCPKYHIDGLRYAGLITDDSPEDIILEVTQEKVSTHMEERTEIQIGPINPPAPIGHTPPVIEMTRHQLIEAYWALCYKSWNRPAFDAIVETLSTEDLRQYVEFGTTYPRGTS